MKPNLLNAALPETLSTNYRLLRNKYYIFFVNRFIDSRITIGPYISNAKSRVKAKDVTRALGGALINAREPVLLFLTVGE